jgi:hypothetical protein
VDEAAALAAIAELAAAEQGALPVAVMEAEMAAAPEAAVLEAPSAEAPPVAAEGAVPAPPSPGARPRPFGRRKRKRGKHPDTPPAD